MAALWQDLALVLGVLLCFNAMPTTEAATNSTDFFGLITIPATANMCTCSLTLSCTCCQSVLVNPLNMNKTICATFKIAILSASVDVSITMDNESVAKFTISATSPPTFCLPVLTGTPVAMCIKMHDVKLVGLTGIQVCSTFYTSFNSNQIVAYAFPCIKLSTSGITVI